MRVLSSEIRIVALFGGARGGVVFAGGFWGAGSPLPNSDSPPGPLAGRKLRPPNRGPKTSPPPPPPRAPPPWALAAPRPPPPLSGLGVRWGFLFFLHGRRWAEWLAAVSGCIYIPYEIYHLFHRATWISVGALALNVFIVGMMIYALLHARPAEMEKAH